MNWSALGSRVLKNRVYWVALVVMWALLTLLSYAWNVRTVEAYAENLAVFRGRLVFQIIQATRLWEDGHGGHPLAGKPASPAPDYEGFNPAVMARQLDELLARETDMRLRLTSLHPLNPGNAPLPWERMALIRFEQGDREFVDKARTPAGPQFRYMAPLPTLESCLPCHAAQGYRTGDVRGAMSITQSAAGITRHVASQLDNLRLLHLAGFLALATITWFSLSLIRRHITALEMERDQRRLMAEELARRMDELKQTQDELLTSEKQASLGRMVAGFAHEVNTPVGVAVGAASHAQEAIKAIDQLLASDEVSEEELRRHLDAIDESAQLTLSNLKRAAALVQSFKRTSVDQISEHDRDYRLSELVDDVLRSLHNVFKRTSIQIRVDCPDDPLLHGPAGALEQILTNLLMNSFHHAYADGSQAGNIHIRTEMTPDQGICLTYRDDGAGMNAESRAQVFEPFYTTRRARGGTGLGMYIVYNLATAKLGGHITCESTPGQGTVFRLAFHPTDPSHGAVTTEATA